MGRGIEWVKKWEFPGQEMVLLDKSLVRRAAVSVVLTFARAVLVKL